MNRIKRILALIHIIPWIIALGNLAWEVFIDNRSIRPKAILIGLYVFYAHLFIFKNYLTKRKFKAYFSYLFVIFLTGPLPFMLYLFLGEGEIRTLSDFQAPYGIVLFFIIVSFIVGTIQILIINTIKKEQLEKQVINTELIYLRSQINPHFLFNTLNNIHTLVYTQAPEAPEAVMRLSSLMRYMIYESNSSTVPLAIEIDYLQDYISLQQLKYELSPVVDFQVEGNIESCHVAPLLFIHILENSYKHSPATLEPGSIKVWLAVKENFLIATFQNPVGNSRANLLEEPGGIGLSNVQKRLQLLYPNQHNLDINQTDKVFKVELKINIFQKQGHERKTNLLYNR